MAFENVNTVSLKNSINSCIDSINYSQSEEIISKITNNDIWCCASRDTFSKALTKLTDEKYKKLEKKLRDYLQIADLIEEYKNIQNTGLEGSVMNEISEKIMDSDEPIESITSLEENSKEVVSDSEKLDDDTMLATIKAKIEGLL